jgi:hypothetical protein
MARRVVFGCALLLSGVLACGGDATAPQAAGPLILTVTPDMIGYSADSISDLWFYRQNASGSTLQFWSIESEIQTELTPGAWTTVKKSGRYTSWPPNTRAETFVAGAKIGGVWSFKVPTGRYRMHYTFEMAKEDGTTPSGDRRSVDSNPFVVTGS